MKQLFLAFIMLHGFFFSYADNDPNQDNKKKPDTMLFGDVVSDSDEHIPFATISIVGTTQGVSADMSGHFKLTGVAEGKQTVRISAVGYASKDYEINFVVGEQNTLRAILRADQIGLEQVVVSGDRSERSRKEVATIVTAIGPKLMEVTQSAT
ncbi:MAG: carboxypeptidase-like regulatory domain-containing protein, partial [Mangrovibacterium sp.]